MPYQRMYMCCALCHQEYTTHENANRCEKLGSPTTLNDVKIGDTIEFDQDYGLKSKGIASAVVIHKVMHRYPTSKTEFEHKWILFVETKMGDKVIMERGVLEKIIDGKSVLVSPQELCYAPGSHKSFPAPIYL